MVIMITGATHTGKTRLAQMLIEKKQYFGVSQDLVKMGLIRAGYTTHTPLDSDIVLTEYLWPVFREMIKTAIENKQNLILEGCYVPFDWKKDFTKEYLDEIQYYCLALSESYIDKHFADVQKFASCIEDRLDDSDMTIDYIKAQNNHYVEGCQANGLDLVLIEEDYAKTIDNFFKFLIDSNVT